MYLRGFNPARGGVSGGVSGGLSSGVSSGISSGGSGVVSRDLPVAASSAVPTTVPGAVSVTPVCAGASKIGVLLVNLGTPDAPTPKAIRRYLAEFLSDPRVIEIPMLLWKPILHGFILPFRPRRLAPRYAETWLADGSPLAVYTRRCANALQQELDAQGGGYQVAMAMRYGSPAMDQALEQLLSDGCERVLMLPLYPQYAASTTATAVDSVMRSLAHWRNQPEVRWVKRFHLDPGYLAALAGRVQAFWAEHGRADRLLMSFHGLPRACVDAGDPYYDDCLETGHALARQLGLGAHEYLITFQSRFGAQRWLEPYTEPTLVALGKQGVGHIDVICPGFVADCLETLEEIAVQARDAFVTAGGQRLRYIPALNDDAAWVQALSRLVQHQTQGWTADSR